MPHAPTILLTCTLLALSLTGCLGGEVQDENPDPITPTTQEPPAEGPRIPVTPPNATPQPNATEWKPFTLHENFTLGWTEVRTNNDRNTVERNCVWLTDIPEGAVALRGRVTATWTSITPTSETLRFLVGNFPSDLAFETEGTSPLTIEFQDFPLVGKEGTAPHGLPDTWIGLQPPDGPVGLVVAQQAVVEVQLDYLSDHEMEPRIENC